MCTGGRLVADFVAGTDARPDLPEVLDEHLTTTVDGLWVLWAYKLARQAGDVFMPLTGGSGYPADARATCRRAHSSLGGHDAPDPRCTCGFHALSSRSLPGLPVGRGRFAALTVALSGRVLAFDWVGGGVLWRAERQTVVRVEAPDQFDWAELERPRRSDRTERARVRGDRRYPGDPDGRLAIVHPAAPRDSGPIRLNLPVSPPLLPVWHDDAGWCVGASTVERLPASLVLA
jgi:hypothetical protein